MNDTDIDKVVKLLLTDHDKFYTDLSAHNSGFKTECRELFGMYNLYKGRVLSRLVTNNQNLIVNYVKFEGKLDNRLDSISVFHNMNIYTDSVVLNDITKDNISLYVQKFDTLTNKQKERIYSLLSKETFFLIVNYNLDVPKDYIKDDYKLLYINHKSGKPNFLQFLQELNQPEYIFKNYRQIKCDIVTKHIMDHVTIINKESFDNLVRSGFSVIDILKYKPMYMSVALPHINTIDEFNVIIGNIGPKTQLKDVELLYERFPYMKHIIDDKIKGLAR